MRKPTWILKNWHLIISVIIVAPTGIIYGTPSLLPKYFDIQVHTIDLSNMLKASMVLYLAISSVWILGMLNSNFWKRATELNILFMVSLSIGRAFSMLIDGLPTGGYVFGFIVEVILGILSIFQRWKYCRLNTEMHKETSLR